MRDLLLQIWPNDVKTLLDLGCRDCWHTAGLPGVTYHAGVDMWPAALERARRKAISGGIPHFEPIQGEALEFLTTCEDGVFDAVLAIDLLEHLERENALQLLDDMERVAARFVAIWTTLGYIPQEPYDVDAQFNPYEEHLWGPTLDVFIDRGWETQVYPEQHGPRGGAILAWKLV